MQKVPKYVDFALFEEYNYSVKGICNSCTLGGAIPCGVRFVNFGKSENFIAMKEKNDHEKMLEMW